MTEEINPEPSRILPRMGAEVSIDEDNHIRVLQMQMNEGVVVIFEPNEALEVAEAMRKAAMMVKGKNRKAGQ